MPEGLNCWVYIHLGLCYTCHCEKRSDEAIILKKGVFIFHAIRIGKCQHIIFYFSKPQLYSAELGNQLLTWCNYPCRTLEC